MKVGVVGLLVCGCGAVTSNEPTADAPSGDALAGACDVTKPFGAPVPIGGVNTDRNDFWGAMSPDRRTLYFTRFESASSGTLYSATREDLADAFSGVALLGGGVNTTGNDEQRPTLTADGRTLFFQIPSEPTGHFDLFTATRDSAAADFPPTAPERVSISVAGAHDWDAAISDDGLTLYFASTRVTGTVDSNIFKAERTSTTAIFREPEAVAELNTTGREHAPVVSTDGLEIFFEKQMGTTRQIFHATRPSRTARFGGVREVVELNDRVNNKDYPNWLSPDRCQLLLSSERPGGAGLADLWIATRPR